ncbi:copper chaperone [Dyadobacter jejuensis]|uniref:Copper chaperone n=1 Tax=Dyadobacter jejuensis TaxID=1082580 RepID=A0A316BA87_9BACT|nr:hypothetical protein [Dyadobacter jejuensis]PWJ59457.1 copper chaperone [Dyadobacter jejuensis]
METLKFKTNIKCGGCIAAVKPVLDQDQKIASWEVDLASPEKILTVLTDHNALEVSDMLKTAGYNAEKIPA